MGCRTDLGGGHSTAPAHALMVFPTHLAIWLYTQPVDLRKSYDGLSALVKCRLQEDPISGQLFAFINRRKTQIKVLYFDH